MGLILCIVLFVLLIGAMPTWGHSRNWGYYPSGGLGLIMLFLIMWMFMGHMHWGY